MLTMSLQKECSNLQEKELAKFLGGKVVAGSGCGNFDAGDVDNGLFLIECKTTTKPQTSFSIKRDWMNKIEEQRFESGLRFSALAFRFDPVCKDYLVIDSDTFKELVDVYLEKLKEENNG